MNSPTSTAAHGWRNLLAISRWPVVVGVMIIAGATGCASQAPGPDQTPTPPTVTAPTTTAPETAETILADMGAAVLNDGGQLLGQYTITGQSSVVVDLPEGSETVGFLLACSATGPTWRVAVGDDDSRWVSGSCTTSIAGTKGAFDVHSSDNGRVTVSTTLSDNGGALLVVFAA